MPNDKYSVLVRWSDEDECYVATVPEFGGWFCAFGETREEAVTAVEDAKQTLIKVYKKDGDKLPDPDVIIK
jgi:antitoxin HicB